MESKILDLYSQGLSGLEISKKLLIKKREVYITLKKYGYYKPRVQISSELWEVIIQEYESRNTTLKALQKKYGVGEKRLLNKLKENHILIRTTSGFFPSENELTEMDLENYLKTYSINLDFSDLDFAKSKSKKYTINFNPFCPLNSESVQYWLGYLAADGCVHTNTNRIDIVTSNDPDHLKTYINFLNKPLSIQQTLDKRNNTYNYCVSFCNAEVKRFLIKIGITPKKSKTLKMNIPLSFPFLRGVFDGDGCITKRGKSCYVWSVATSSKEFANQIKEFLDMNFIVCTLSKTKNNYSVRVGGSKNLKRLYKYLYFNAEYFLNRKEKIFSGV